MKKKIYMSACLRVGRKYISKIYEKKLIVQKLNLKLPVLSNMLPIFNVLTEIFYTL